MSPVPYFNGDGPGPEGMVVVVSWETITVEPTDVVDLTALQDAVGGYIERVPLPPDSPVTMWVNEDGLSLRLPGNAVASRYYRQAWGNPHNVNMKIVGNAVFTGCDENGALPLSRETVYELTEVLLSFDIGGPPVKRNGF
tara:strand:+ start:1983 stop:2402 length:420 start_codon:yes stop_codon:yes gene_type:complete